MDVKLCDQPVPLHEYKDIFINVKKWGKFEHSDIKRNQIHDAQDIPDFVTTFERKLVRKPRLHPNVRPFLDFSVCCSILMGQCRCMLYRKRLAFLNHILSIPRTRRSLKTNLTRKHAMPRYQR